MAGFVERSLVPQSPVHPHAVRKRALKAGLGVTLMLSCLGAAFFPTQILRNSEFALRASGVESGEQETWGGPPADPRSDR